LFRLLLAIGLIIGYTIGLGFIYVSITVGSIGFWPTLISSFLIWAFVLYTGLLYLEVTFDNPEGANVPTIAKKYLGPVGSVISSIAFIIVHYAYSTFYFVVGSSVIIGAIKVLFGVDLPPYLAYFFILFFIGVCLFLGAHFCMVLNALFVLGLIISLIFLFVQGFIPFVHDNFVFQNWIYFLLGVSGLYDLFYFQSTIPTVATYLKRNWRRAKAALWIGTLVPLFLFWLWMWFIETPSIEIKFVQAFGNYHPFLQDLLAFHRTHFGGIWIDLVMFLGFLTGLLSTSVVFFDFFTDLFRVVYKKGTWLKRAGICFLVVFPSAFLSTIPHPIIRQIISSAEGFGEVFLGAMVPVFCVWFKRYVHKTSYTNKISCNKAMLIFLAVLAAFLFYTEGISTLDLIVW